MKTSTRRRSKAMSRGPFVSLMRHQREILGNVRNWLASVSVSLTKTLANELFPLKLFTMIRTLTYFRYKTINHCLPTLRTYILFWTSFRSKDDLNDSHYDFDFNLIRSFIIEIEIQCRRSRCYLSTIIRGLKGKCNFLFPFLFQLEPLLRKLTKGPVLHTIATLSRRVSKQATKQPSSSLKMTLENI